MCFDKKSKQLVGEVCTPIPAAPGRAECHDDEYVRNGTANLFLLVEPLRGWRQVDVTTRRTKLDFAKQMKEPVDVHYPGAAKITLLMDNLNTHRSSCLYEAFAPTEARRLIEKTEVVHTPKHGSWLNLAECELSVLEKQCLGERIADQATLRRRMQVWNDNRNSRSKNIDGQFRTADARIKLRRRYPQTEME